MVFFCRRRSVLCVTRLRPFFVGSVSFSSGFAFWPGFDPRLGFAYWSGLYPLFGFAYWSSLAKSK